MLETSPVGIYAVDTENSVTRADWMFDSIWHDSLSWGSFDTLYRAFSYFSTWSWGFCPQQVEHFWCHVEVFTCLLHTVKYIVPQLLFIFNCYTYVSRPKKWGHFSSSRCGHCPLPLTYGRQSVQVDFCMPVVIVFIVPVITSIIEDDTLFFWGHSVA